MTDFTWETETPNLGGTSFRTMTTPTIRVLREDDTEVKEGDTIIDFRGKPWTFLMVTRANKIYAKDPWETSRAKGGFPDEQSAVNAAQAVVAGREQSWEDLRADGGLPEAR